MATYIQLGRDIVKKYCMKEESRIAGPWSDARLYMGQDLPTQLFPWQQEVKEQCDQEPDDRSINYIIDQKGNTGKSKFCKYMAYHHGALVLPWGRTGDLKSLVVKMGAKQIYFFDLSRSKPADWNKDDIAAAMEEIKNGYIVNTKYETSTFMMAPPHIWCFSNQLPNLSSMSRDRWQLWEIDALRQLVRVTTRRYKELLSSERERGDDGRRRDVVDLSIDLSPLRSNDF